jgi:hypothetical protein
LLLSWPSVSRNRSAAEVAAMSGCPVFMRNPEQQFSDDVPFLLVGIYVGCFEKTERLLAKRIESILHLFSKNPSDMRRP